MGIQNMNRAEDYIPRFNGIEGERRAKSGSRRKPSRATVEQFACMAEEQSYRHSLDDPPELFGEDRRLVEELSRLTRKR